MIKIVDTTFRDAQQSLIATRMRYEDMEPVLAKMDNMGFYAMEVWGGATFDSCLRFLKEDPWERLRKIKAICKKTKLQMLFRGQNILGYKAYPDDVVEAFVEKTVENGIDILRIFDALNDLRNLESSVKAVKKTGAEAQLAISYTTSEIHTTEYFIELAKQLENMGADSIAVKDMAGLLLPQTAYELVSGIRANTKLPIEIHSHYTSGLAAMSYMKAIEAGADRIDTAVSAFAMGTSQPATEVMVAALKGTAYDTGIDGGAFAEISDYFRKRREEAIEEGLLSHKVLGVDVDILLYQVPGGMLSNLISQMKAQNAEDRYEEVLKEIQRVRADLGYPPLVTPTSQIVGTQAVMNVLSGERYKMTPKETKDVVRGMYGKTPALISEEIRKKIIGDEQPITVKPSSLLKPGLEDAKKNLGDYRQCDEDVLSYALFPHQAMDYFKFRQAQQTGVDPKFYDKENNVYPV